MKIVTTPMCKGLLDIVGVNNYIVSRDPDTANPDLSIVLSETKTRSEAIRLKLNTFPQIRESMKFLFKRLRDLCPGNLRYKSFAEIKVEVCAAWWDDVNFPRDRNKKIKVKVYSNFLKEIIEDMGYTIVEDNPDFVVYPDYMRVEEEDAIKIPSHDDLPIDPIKRALIRYKILEKKICMRP